MPLQINECVKGRETEQGKAGGPLSSCPALTRILEMRSYVLMTASDQMQEMVGGNEGLGRALVLPFMVKGLISPVNCPRERVGQLHVTIKSLGLFIFWLTRVTEATLLIIRVSSELNPV